MDGGDFFPTVEREVKVVVIVVDIIVGEDTIERGVLESLHHRLDPSFLVLGLPYFLLEMPRVACPFDAAAAGIKCKGT